MRVRNMLAWAGVWLIADQIIVAAIEHAWTSRVTVSDRFIPLPVIPGFLLAALALAGLYAALRREHGYERAFALLVAGFASNLLSYFAYGHFVDFIPTGVSVINGADLLVVAGAVLVAGRLVGARE